MEEEKPPPAFTEVTLVASLNRAYSQRRWFLAVKKIQISVMGRMKVVMGLFVLFLVEWVFAQGTSPKLPPLLGEGRGRSIISFTNDQRPPSIYRRGYRGYKTNCRCEKISNCPQLQISIPRCPSEQFFCCFSKPLQ
ncbi:hypothetical protein C0J52_10898 [Blattella germanica]|nr:hypothetical protein C0J52_10898 [Blattella germanica]